MGASIRLFGKADILSQALAMQTSLRREIHQLHAEICQALSDPTRILILYELRDGPRNVSELAESLDAPQPTISRHLKILRDRRVVLAERSGTSMYYSLADSRVVRALDLLREVLAGSIEQRQALIEEIAA